MKVKFSDLSAWLKTLVVFGYIALGYTVLAFTVGFMYGLGY